MSKILPHDHPANRIKPCIDCGVEYPPENFPIHKHPQGYKGLVVMPRCKDCHRVWKTKSHYLKSYGITSEQYDEMLASQKGCCSLCGCSGSGPNKDKLVVDHCHSSGKVRGLLCWPCNIGLGMFKDNIDLLDKVKIYLSANIA